MRASSIGQPTWADYIERCSEIYAPLSGMIATTFHRNYLPDFTALLHSVELEEVDRLCLLLLKPDCIRAGKVAATLQYLEAAGVQILHHDVFNALPERNVEELYRFALNLGNARPMIGDWWLFRRVFEHGPTILALATIKGDSGPTLFERMRKVKGANIPAECTPGQLRYDLGALSRTINLLHTSDDPLSSLRELAIFYDVPTVIRIVSDAIGAVHRGTADVNSHLRCREISNRFSTGQNGMSEFCRVATALRGAALGEWLGHGCAPSPQENTDSMLPFGVQLNLMRRHWKRDEGLLRCLAGEKRLSAGRQALLFALNDLIEFKSTDMQAILNELDEQQFSPWDVYVLTSVFNFQNDLKLLMQKSSQT